MKRNEAIQNRQLLIFKALANANRLRIMKAIMASPDHMLNVTRLSHQLNLSPPKVSDHLKLLRVHKLVKAKQTGAQMWYSIKDPILYTLLRDVR